MKHAVGWVPDIYIENIFFSDKLGWYYISFGDFRVLPHLVSSVYY